MAFINQYPYSDFHNLNLDWILNTIKENTDYVKQIEALVENFDISGKVAEELVEMYNDGRLQTLVNNAISPDILLVGDSFGEGYQPDSSTRQGWIYYFKQYIHTGANIYNTYMGGASFLRDDEASFKTLIQTAALGMTESQRAKIGHVIIIGGTNESLMTNNSTLSARIQDCVAMTHSTFPNTKVYIGFTANVIKPKATAYTTPTYQKVRLNMSTCADAYMHTLADYVYLDGVENVLLSQSTNPMASDGMHPSVSGYEILGNAILKAWLHGGLGNISAWGSIPLTSNSNIFGNTTSLALRYQIAAGTIKFSLFINGTTGTNTVNIAPNYNIANATPIATFTPGSPIRGFWWDSMGEEPWTHHIKLRTTGEFVNANLGLIFKEDGNIYIGSGDVDSTGQAFANYAIRLSKSDGITFLSPTYPLWLL